MEERNEFNNEISLMDIIRILLSKIKLLILVVLISGIVGGMLAVCFTMKVKYYGTDLEFYVNPTSDDVDLSSSNSEYAVYGSYGGKVMDAITKLLESESFTERLMLDRNGLPNKEEYPGLDEAEYAEAEEALKKSSEAWDKVDEKLETVNLKKEDLQKAWKNIGYSNTYTKAYYKSWLKSEEGLECQDKNPDLIMALESAYDALDAAQEDYNNVLKLAESLRSEAEYQAEEVYEQWRKMEQYEENMDIFSEAVSYGYFKDEDEIANDYPARSFIYVSLSVRDKKTAQIILEKIKQNVPDYVETNMFVPSGYTGTSCTRITRTDDIELLNPTYTLMQGLKFGILAAALSGVIAAVVVFILDRSKKNNPDPEQVLKSMNVPVLEAIPVTEEQIETTDETNAVTAEE